MRTVKTAAAVRVACRSAARTPAASSSTASDRDQEGAAGADPARFGWREQAAVKPADDEGEQRQRGPHVAQRLDPLAPVASRSRGQKARPDEADGSDREHVHRDGEHSGQDPGDEQLADVLLGDQAVDGQHRGRRKNGAERSAGGDHPGGEGLRISVSPHLRISDSGEGRCGRHRRTADRGEAGASGDRREAEAAPPVADKTVGRPEEFAAHARRGDEGAHQKEHRDDAERVVGDRPHRGLSDHFQRGAGADDGAVAGHAHETHRHPDRDTQQDQRKESDKADDGRRVGAHRLGLIPTPWRSDRGRAFRGGK